MAISLRKIIITPLILGITMVLLSQCSQIEGPDTPGQTDSFAGEFDIFQLGEQLANFREGDAVCYIKTPDGTIITRECTHERDRKGISRVKFNVGLRAGVYRLLYFDYGGEESYGLGMRVEFRRGLTKVLDSYDPLSGLNGSGTESDPYIITAANHLTLMREFTNTHPTTGVYFRQEADILGKYMKTEVTNCDPVHFWTPIGYDMNNPFCGIYDGNGHYIEYVKAIGDAYSNGFALGLFGYVRGATFIDIKIQNSYVKGSYAVGLLAGVAISRGGASDTTRIINCSIYSSEAYGFDGSVSVGGLLGVVDSRSVLSMAGCKSEESFVSADYNAGGLVGAGAQNSSILLNLCTNNSSVNVAKGSAGGIIAVGDTVNITACKNLSSAVVSGPESDIDQTQRAIGGIIGGGRAAWVTACENNGQVKGYEGVGGIVGSTRINYSNEDGYMFSDILLRYCKNTGKVSGNRHVGGLCGEAQLGCFGSLNSGEVSGHEYIGGIVGNSSVAAIHNCANNGKITGTGKYVAGIAALTNMGIIADVQNFAEITGSGSNAAGIVGYAVNNTLIHFCANYGKITGSDAPIGGIVAEMGKEDELSIMNIAEICFGAVQLTIGLILGPSLTIAEHVIGGTIGTALMISDIILEGLVAAAEVIFMSITGSHMNHIHNQAILTELSSTIEKDCNDLMDEIKTLRESQDVVLSEGLSADIIEKAYPEKLASLSDYLQSEENVLMFNDTLNMALRARGQEVADLNEKHEETYLIVGGLLLAAEIVAVVGAGIITGGTAVPAVIMGLFSIGAATNSIVKGTTDYQDNIVMVTQSLNAGEITGCQDSFVGGIAGHFRKRGYISDCLNTGKGPGGEGGQLVGYIDNEYTAKNSLCLADPTSWGGAFGDIDNTVGQNETLEGIYFYDHGSHSSSKATELSISQLSQSSSYKGWAIGEDKPWVIKPSDDNTKASFPIPNKSFPIPSN